MGKGGGCFPSKSHRLPLPAPPRRRARTSIPAVAAAPAATPRPVRVYVVFYSMYGHVRLLARSVQRGVCSIPGARGILFRVPETLPPAVLSQMGALKPADEEEMPMVDPDGLPDADGFLFGFPARYGAMAAQMQAFFDSTAPLCRCQSLAGKPAGFFVSTGTQCGGQETTAWTAITQLAHHGMMFVPIGYTFGEGMFEMEELRRGSSPATAPGRPPSLSWSSPSTTPSTWPRLSRGWCAAPMLVSSQESLPG